MLAFATSKLCGILVLAWASPALLAREGNARGSCEHTFRMGLIDRQSSCLSQGKFVCKEAVRNPQTQKLEDFQTHSLKSLSPHRSRRNRDDNQKLFVRLPKQTLASILQRTEDIDQMTNHSISILQRRLSIKVPQAANNHT